MSNLEIHKGVIEWNNTEDSLDANLHIWIRCFSFMLAVMSYDDNLQKIFGIVGLSDWQLVVVVLATQIRRIRMLNVRGDNIVKISAIHS